LVVFEICSELTNRHPAGDLIAGWNRYLEPPLGTKDDEEVERDNQSIYSRSDGRTELCWRIKAIAEEEYGIIAKFIVSDPAASDATASDEVCHTTV
jgi:hypothetical protein